MIVGVRAARGLISRFTVVFAVTVSFAVPAASPPPARLTALVPTPAPALELKDTAGQVHRLADYRGKVVLVNFWATWCEPCRDEMPSMQRLKDRMDKVTGAPLVILAVNHGEGAARVEEFVKKVPLAFPLLLDPFSEVWRLWKPGVLPASFLVGRDGRMHYRVIGEIDWSGAEAAAAIQRLLSTKG